MNASYDMPVFRVQSGILEEITDPVAAEAAFSLVVNGQILVSLLCSPMDLDTMAVGFLISEGLLDRLENLERLDVDAEKGRVQVVLRNLPPDWQERFHQKTITSGCGKGITFSDPSRLQPLAVGRQPLVLSAADLPNLFNAFRDRSELFRTTGGVHSAALSDGRDIQLFSEDIGRHNAVDKLIGKAFLQQISLTDKILLSSGRISGEIMTKVVRSRIPVLISRAAPTCMSISSAEEYGVTLIGFARGHRMNIYTHPFGVVFRDS